MSVGEGVHTIPPDQVDSEVVVAFFYEDQRPLFGPAALLDWRMNGLLTGLLVRGEAVGRAGEHVLVPANSKLQASWVFWCGAGAVQGVDESTLQGLVAHVAQTCLAAGLKDVTLCFDPLEGAAAEKIESLASSILTQRQYSELDCRLSLYDVGLGCNVSGESASC